MIRCAIISIFAVKIELVLPSLQQVSFSMKPRSDFTLQEANMGRQTDRQRLEQINDYVEQHPGVRPAEIAR